MCDAWWNGDGANLGDYRNRCKCSTVAAMADLQQVMSALGSPVRREILGLTWDRDLAVGDIGAAFEVTGATISQHLGVLREAGLVSMVVDGNFRRYRANQAALRGLDAAIFEEPSKWTPADQLPETAQASTRTSLVVHASALVDVTCGDAYRAFTDPIIYSRWLGVEVMIDGGRFACDMEFGTRIRGWYEHVVAPSLIALRWNFSDDNIPVPGHEMTAYMRFAPTDSPNRTGAQTVTRVSTRIDVHQLVESRDHAVFMETAWAVVLGRCVAGIGAAIADSTPAQRRTRRPKQTPLS